MLTQGFLFAFLAQPSYLINVSLIACTQVKSCVLQHNCCPNFKMIFFYFLIFVTESESAIHSDVVITGTTVQPGFHRAEGRRKFGEF
jgi:hypothetical protein